MRSTTFQAEQQLTAASFHRRRTVSRGVAQNVYHSGSNRCIGVSQIYQALKGEGLDDGTAVFQVTVQYRHRELSLCGVQWKPRNHGRQMPAQFLLSGLGHQTQQLFFVRSEESGIF